MPQPANLVHETSTSTGTGNLTLTNVNGKNSFNNAFGTGGTDVFDYFLSNQAAAEWERGTGHLSDATTLVRDTVIESTNSNNAVNFSAGTKDVTNAIPALEQTRISVGTVQATTSGTTIDFTGIAAGANRITVMLQDVAMDATDNLLIQIGDSGGIVATAYSSISADVTGTSSSTAGFIIENGSTSLSITGIMTLTRLTGNTWISGHTAQRIGASSHLYGAGSKTLTGELTQLRLTSVSASDFVAGQVNIFYE